MIKAFQGEFGLKVRYHVPQTYARGHFRLIQIEAGDEALYPRADAYEIVERADDDVRALTRPEKGLPEERFVPEPYNGMTVDCDVVICPRKRHYGSEKNWPWWHLFEGLPGVFAAGAPDSSYDVNCERAWDYDRFLDASIAALRSARLCVATDAGLAHLALLCGTPLFLITHCGRVAPGPIHNSRGERVADEYWHVRLDEYYHAANHRDAPIHVSPAWRFPKLVREQVTELL